MDVLHADLVFSIILLVAALGLGMLAERVRIPYTVMLFLASVPLYVPNLPFRFDPSLLTVVLPALIFEATWNLSHAALRRTWGAVALLAGPGVIVTAVIVGVGLSVLRLLPLPQALLLGVILAATDPVAVIAVFRRLKIPLYLTTVVEAESLFNDGTAFVAYGAVVGAIMAGSSGVGLLAWSVNAIAGSLGGALIGVAVALLLARTLRVAVDPFLHIVATLVGAYGSYLAAESLHGSGIFATIAAGIGLRGFVRRLPEKREGAEIEIFWSVLAFLANSLLFLLIGLRIEFPRILHQPTLVLGTLLLLVLARLLVVYVVLPAVRVPDERPAWRHVMMLAGMRGALSLALALSLPATLPMRPQIIDAVFAAVFVTMVAQGMVIGPLVARLSLSL